MCNKDIIVCYMPLQSKGLIHFSFSWVFGTEYFQIKLLSSFLTGYASHIPRNLGSATDMVDVDKEK